MLHTVIHIYIVCVYVVATLDGLHSVIFLDGSWMCSSRLSPTRHFYKVKFTNFPPRGNGATRIFVG